MRAGKEREQERAREKRIGMLRDVIREGASERGAREEGKKGEVVGQGEGRRGEKRGTRQMTDAKAYLTTRTVVVSPAPFLSALLRSSYTTLHGGANEERTPRPERLCPSDQRALSVTQPSLRL